VFWTHPYNAASGVVSAAGEVVDDGDEAAGGGLGGFGIVGCGFVGVGLGGVGLGGIGDGSPPPSVLLPPSR
jgi:hypothetical protein